MSPAQFPKAQMSTLNLIKTSVGVYFNHIQRH